MQIGANCPDENTMRLPMQLSFPITTTLQSDPHQNHSQSTHTGGTLDGGLNQLLSHVLQVCLPLPHFYHGSVL